MKIEQILMRLRQALWHRADLVGAANVAEGTHAGALSKKTDAAISTRYLLVKVGSDSDHVEVCGANDRPRGVCEDEAGAAEDLVSVGLLGASDRTRLMVASEAIDDDVDVFTAASGKVQTEPTAEGTYYKVGRSLQSASGDGETLEVEPMHPIAYEVSA